MLLVVGESGAHASRVLDQDVFDEPPRALERFTCVRVDAYDRPDVAARFGGPFPLVALLAPGGECLACERRPTAATVERLLANANVNVNVNANANANRDVWREVAASFDAHNAGFGALPKSPRAPLLDLLLDDGRHAALALRTLDAVLQGGIHDHLAGGFHRDSTDAKWIVPHFEKRLTDQAALLSTLARAYGLGREPRWARAAEQLVGALERLGRGGAFAGLEDADVGPYDDGGHWTFTLDEARAALPPDELAVAQPVFDLFGRGELHGDPTRNVLFRAVPLATVARTLALAPDEAERRLERARVRLLAARDARARPAVDESLYTAPNACLARALLEAADALSVDRLRTVALELLARLYAESLTVGGRVRHRLGIDAPPDWLPSHAQLALAARAAHEASGDPRHADVAAAILARVTRDRAHFSSQIALVVDDEQPSPAALWLALTGAASAIPAPPQGIDSAALIAVAMKHLHK